MRPILSALPVVALSVFLPIEFQAQSNDPVLRVESRVVQVDVVVKGKDGRPVEGLQRGDFTIRDNGKPREFQIFSFNGTAAPAANGKTATQLAPNVFSNANASAANLPPHSTVLLLDYVNGWFDNAGTTRNSVLSLMAKVPKDEPIAIYVLSKYQGMVVLQEYTTNRELLIRHMSKYIPNGMEPAPVGMENFMGAMSDNAVAGQGGGRSTGSSPLAVTKETPQERGYLMHQASEMVRLSLKALALHLAAVPGRKSVFWVTQGFPPTEMRGMGEVAWDNTIHNLNDANVAVNTVDSNLIGGPPRRWGPHGQVAAEIQLAERTGGKAYYHRNDIDEAMLQGIQDARQTYTLGFYLGDNERDGAFHRLEVRVDRPHLELHFRPGYFAGENQELKAARKSDEMESILLSPVDSGDLGISVRVDRRPGSLSLGIQLDTRALSLKQLTDSWSGEVKEMFVATNAEGREVLKISDTKKFEIPAASRGAYDRDGIPLASTIPYPDGAEKLAIIIRDVKTGRTGSLTIPIAH